MSRDLRPYVAAGALLERLEELAAQEGLALHVAPEVPGGFVFIGRAPDKADAAAVLALHAAHEAGEVGPDLQARLAADPSGCPHAVLPETLKGVPRVEALTRAVGLAVVGWRHGAPEEVAIRAGLWANGALRAWGLR